MTTLLLLAVLAQDDAWTVEKGTDACTHIVKMRRDPLALAVSPDGKRIAVGAMDSVLVADVADAKLVTTFKLSGGAVRGLAFSADGSHLAAASIGGVRLVDVSGKVVWHVKGHPSPMQGGEGAYSAAFIDGGDIVTGSRDDGSLRVWSVKDGAAGATIDTKLRQVGRLELSPDRKLIAVTDGEKTLALYDIAGKELWRNSGNLSSAIAFSPDGKRLATGVTVGMSMLKSIDTATGKGIGDIAIKANGPLAGIGYAADGKSILAVGTRSGGLIAAADSSVVVIDEKVKGNVDADRALVIAGGTVVIASDKSLRFYALK